ncbi:UNKNOWN [Stylonychia lemnae]|uniref:Cadherin domain-containing protein n=1 Tax=Stylonychia lemnae TaxID=5949 RepID=A0A077ZWK5_STYLE|nr:UNKNOWN [Stylonychia lemnae]|eukprot:CDW73667.1 UNKNOWN [Stylonychia lemnae]
MIGINTSRTDLIGKHQIPIEVQVQSDRVNELLGKIQTIFEFEIYSYSNPFSKGNTAPYFVIPLQNIEVSVGDSQVIDLPKIIDDEGDRYKVQLKTKLSSLFLDSTNNKIIINPIEAEVGIHQIIVTIEDNNANKKYVESSFKITIKADISSFYEQLLKGSSLLEDYQKSKKFQIQGNIEAREWDLLIVRFKMYFQFYDNTEKLMMKEGYQIKNYIPPQMSQSLQSMMNNLGVTAAVSLQSVIGSNFLINILMQFNNCNDYLGPKAFRCFGE